LGLVTTTLRSATGKPALFQPGRAFLLASASSRGEQKFVEFDSGTSTDSAFDSALLAVLDEFDGLLTGGKKQKLRVSGT
jgi:hypothetical protein